MDRLTRALVILPAALLAVTVARAGYDPVTPRGYTLAAVPEEDRSSVEPGNPLVAAAEHAAGMQIDALFEVRQGMSRAFDSSGTELLLTSTRPQPAPHPAFRTFRVGGRPLYIAHGSTPREYVTDGNVIA